MIENRRLFVGTYLMLVGLLVIRLLPLIFPESRSWGFNYLLFLPDWYTATFVLLSSLALVFPFLKSAEATRDRIIASVNRYFFDSPHQWFCRLGVTAVLVFLFVLFSAETHFLGDGYQLIANLSVQSVHFFKWSELGTAMIQSGIHSLLGPPSETTARLTFQIISYASGALSIWLYFLIAHIITDNPLRRVLVLITLLGSGTLLLFFGYIENYPLLQACYAALIYFGLRRLKTGRGVIPTMIILLMGILLHLQMAVFIPAVIYLGLATGTGNRIYRRYRPAVISLLVFAGVGVIGLSLYTYLTDISFAGHFMPLLKDKAVAPGYTIFSFSHLLDIFNELLLLSPTLVLFVIPAYSNMALARRSRTVLFLLLSCVGGLLFLLLIDPKLSMPRDWDLFSLSALSPTLLLVYLLPDEFLHTARRLFLSLGMYLVLAVGMFLLTGLQTETSIRNIEYIIHLDRGKSLSSLICLRDYYRKQGEEEKKDSVNMTYYFYYQDDRMIKEAFDALGISDIARAERLLTLITPDKFNANYRSLLATYHFIKGNHETALRETQQAISLGLHTVDLYRKLGLVHLALRQDDEAAGALHRALEIEPSNDKTIENLAAVFLASRRVDSVVYYTNLLLTADSGNVQGYVLLYSLYSQINQSDSARKYADLYHRFGGPDSAGTKRP